MSLEWQSDGQSEGGDDGLGRRRRRALLVAKVARQVQFDVGPRQVGRMPATKGGDSEFRRQGRSEVPISPLGSPRPSLLLSKCTTMHNALLVVGKRKRALGIHGMRCSYNNFDKMRMEEEGAFAPEAMLIESAVKAGSTERDCIHGPTHLLSSPFLHLAPGEPRPLSFFVGKIRQCSAFSPRCVTKTVGQVSCRVSCGRQGRRCWVGLIPRIIHSTSQASVLFRSLVGETDLCHDRHYNLCEGNKRRFCLLRRCVCAPARLFAPFRSPVRSSSRTTDSFGSGTA